VQRSIQPQSSLKGKINSYNTAKVIAKHVRSTPFIPKTNENGEITMELSKLSSYMDKNLARLELHKKLAQKRGSSTLVPSLQASRDLTPLQLANKLREDVAQRQVTTAFER